MKVWLLIGANAYACIRHDAGAMDVLLQPGRSAAQSLRESAADERDQAARKIRRAELMDQAAAELERE